MGQHFGEEQALAAPLYIAMHGDAAEQDSGRKREIGQTRREHTGRGLIGILWSRVVERLMRPQVVIDFLEALKQALLSGAGGEAVSCFKVR